MANELTVIRTVEAQDGSMDWNMLYWFNLSTDPVVDNIGATVVTQSTTQLAPEISKHLDQTTQLDPIDTGVAGFLVKTLRQSLGESNPNFLSRAQADYAATKAFWLAQQKDIWKSSGLQRDA